MMKTPTALRPGSATLSRQPSSAAPDGNLHSLRTCYVRGDADGMLGLHLSRAPWDPYPWISSVQSGSSAAAAGLRVGDCVLEVNGADVLGQRIAEVAERIRHKWRPTQSTAGTPEKGVTFLLWNSKAENNLNPHSLQKFTACLQSVAQLLECPICLDVVRPPAWQCCHGHVLCGPCRGRSTRCPICRVTFGPRGRCLIADQLFTLLAETFPCENKETGHQTCTATAPCSRTQKLSNSPTSPPPTSAPPNSRNQKAPASDPMPTVSPVALRLHCPHTAGDDCPALGSAYELLTHLQRSHKTTITQYYCGLGDRVAVRFAERSISALAIAKNGQLELFLVLRRGASRGAQSETAGDTCWVWYVGAEEVAATYRVRLEAGGGERGKWRGVARALDAGDAGRSRRNGAGWWQQEGSARIEADVSTVWVEIK